VISLAAFFLMLSKGACLEHQATHAAKVFFLFGALTCILILPLWHVQVILVVFSCCCVPDANNKMVAAFLFEAFGTAIGMFSCARSSLPSSLN